MMGSSRAATEPAEDVMALDAALAAFHRGSAAELERFFSSITKTGNSYRSDLAARLLAAQPVTELTPDALEPWMGVDVAGLCLTPDIVAGWQRILDSPATDKIRLLAALADAEPGSGAAVAGDQMQAWLNGTLMVDVPFIGVTLQGAGGTGRILLMSLQSPLDALYLPDQRLLVRAGALRFSASERLKKMVAWMLRNPEDWWRFWEGRAAGGLAFLLRDNRPYHVLLDELSGHFDLQEQGLDLPMVYLNRAAFIESGRLLADLVPGGREQGVFAQAIVTHHRRANKDDFGLRFHDVIGARARRYAETAAPDGRIWPEEDPRPLVWIGIAGGEKRRWFEEEAALIASIGHVQDRVGPCRFVFDGWTVPLRPGEKDGDQIAQHLALRDRIVTACGLEPDAHHHVIGTGVLTKLDMARRADFFVSCGGTPSVWPSLVCGLPGVVHNSRSMLPRVGNTYRPENVIRIPDSMIEDVNEVGDAIRWDRYSYHIAVADFLTCLDRALDLLLPPP